MKNLILIVALFAVSFNASAKEIEACEFVSETAELFMDLRQKGVSLKKMLSIKHTDRMEVLIMKAWKVDVYQSKEYQQKAINKFRDDMHMLCLEKTKQD